ncbi:MAG: hypothetical protein Q7U91_04660 [Sideroxyarcus sp.]|nr:hypothetical protein [Sideroxyarcus sp.]
MKNRVYSLLPVLLLSCTLCGCAALEQRQAPAHKEGPVDAESRNSAAAQAGHREQPSPASRTSVNLHVFGLSYHPDREGIHTNQLDNEFNYGLGLGFQLHEDALGTFHSEAGVFKDSGNNWAKFAGVCYLFKLGEHWNAGADLMVVRSPTYNFGHAFVAALPHLAYDFEKVKVNAVYIPRYKELSRFSAFAFYLTFPLWK